MSPIEQSVILAAAVAGILLFASVVGFTLKLAVAHGAPNTVIDNLNARIRAWWMMAVACGLAFLAGKNGTIVLFALISFFALREYVTVVPTRRSDHAALIASFYVVIPLQYWLIWADWRALYPVLIPVFAFVVLPVLAARAGDARDFLQGAATIQWGLMVTVFSVSHAPMLLTLDLPGYEGQNMFLLVFLILVVQTSDVLQYIWGKLAGKRQIAPRVSPSKTVEGFVGGTASATLIGAALWWITPFTLLQAALVSFIITLMGFFGGLVMSTVKRDRGVKDWGNMIQGHGGILDRVDSLCFSAPVFFYIVRCGWAS
jgi:phosphatidate cytidylyltransferase